MQQVRSPRVDRIARLSVAGCLVGGPLAGIVVRAALPSPATASIARSVADYAGNPGATRAVLIADAFLFLLVPAALGATALAWRRAPVLALLAGVVSLIGWSAIVMLAAQDALIAEAGRQVYADGQGAAIAATWSGETLVAGTITAASRCRQRKADRELGELRPAAQHSVVEIRRIAHDLRAPALDQLGLVGALRAQVERFAAGIGITSIRERALELGGSLVVERRQPAGTRVLAILSVGA